MLKRLIPLFLALLMSYTVGAQTFKELGGTGQIANGFMARESLLLPDDTVLTKAKNVDTCQQIAKKGGILYTYNCETHRWEELTGNSKGVPMAKNISELRSLPALTAAPNKVLYVAGYYNPGDEGGGFYYWSDTSTIADNGGSVIKVASLTTGRWFMIPENDEISVRRFGAKGDGVDDTEPVRRMFDTYRANPIGGGARILFPAGVFILDSVHVYSGTDVFSKQLARDNVLPYVRSRIMPKNGAKYVFYLDDAAKNCEFSGIYVNGDYDSATARNAGLLAAVRWGGSFNMMSKCALTMCAQSALKGINLGQSKIIDNLFSGWHGPNPIFTDTADFRGVIDFINMGECYIDDNEISASIKYFTKRGMAMAHDSLYGRICAMVIKGSATTTWINRNYFENSDRAIVIKGGTYFRMSKNRIELSVMGGLLITGAGTYYMESEGDAYADNGLGKDKTYSDIEVTPGALGYAYFRGTTFTKIGSGLIPETYNRMRYNFNNRGSQEIALIHPAIDTSYVDLVGGGVFNNNTIDFQPTRQADEQYNPRDPLYNSLTVGGLGNLTKITLDTAYRGRLVITRGQTNAAGGAPASMAFYDAANNTVAGFNFDASFNLYYTLFGSGRRHVFNGGTMVNSVNGGGNLDLQSANGAGFNTLNFFSDPVQTRIGRISQNTTNGDLSILSTSTMGLSSTGFTFLGGAITIAKPAGNLLQFIGDGTGINSVRLSSDGLATHSLEIKQNNVTGQASIESGDTLNLGIAHNFKLAPNGLTYIIQPPNSRTSADYNYAFLGRDTITGEMVVRRNTYWDSAQTKTYISNGSTLTTASNGLTKNAGNVALGGTLTGNTSIDLLTSSLNMQSSTGFSGSARLEVNSGTFGLYAAGTPFSYLKMFTDGSTVTNEFYDAFSKGIVTSADYSAAQLLDDNAYLTTKGVKKIVHDSLAGGSSVNIYNSNGSLTANRTVSGASTYSLTLNSLSSYSVNSAGSMTMSHSTTGAGFGADGFGGLSISGGNLSGGGGISIEPGQNNSNISLVHSYANNKRIVFSGMVNSVAEDSVIAVDVNGKIKQKAVTLDNVLANGNTSTRIANVGALGVSGLASFNGGVYMASRTVTTTSSLSVSDQIIFVNNSGAVTITLPPVASSSGMVLWIKKESAAVNDVTVKGNASELIDLANTKVLTLQGSAIQVHSNGTKWHIIGGFAAATTL